MGHQHQAGAVRAVELQHLREHRGGGLFVQVAGGLVAQHAGRRVDQGACHRSALAFAAGQFARLVLQAMAEAHRLQQVARALAGLMHALPAQQHRHHHVFKRGELRQQVMELVDEAQRTVAQAAALGIGQRAHLLPGHEHLACSGHVKPTQQVQQGALAGAGRAQDRYRLAGLHPEIEAIEYLRVKRALGVRLAELFGADHFIVLHRLTHSAAPPRVRCARRARPGTGWRRTPWPAPRR